MQRQPAVAIPHLKSAPRKAGNQLREGGEDQTGRAHAPEVAEAEEGSEMEPSVVVQLHRRKCLGINCLPLKQAPVQKVHDAMPQHSFPALWECA